MSSAYILNGRRWRLYRPQKTIGAIVRDGPIPTEVQSWRDWRDDDQSWPRTISVVSLSTLLRVMNQYRTGIAALPPRPTIPPLLPPRMDHLGETVIRRILFNGGVKAGGTRSIRRTEASIIVRYLEDLYFAYQYAKS